jgi:hypothetical protein
MRRPSAFAALLAVAAIVAGCGGGGEAPRSRPAASAQTGTAGVSVELEPGWHAGAATDGNVVDPLTRVVASSAPVRPREVPCQIERYAPPSTEVTLVIVEWQASGGARFEPRPERFAPEAVELYPPPAIECFEGAGGSVQFADHARLFGAYLLAGERAPQRLIDQAFGVLNSLTVDRREAADRRLARNGVSISVPAGWDGRMLFRDAAGSWGVIFQTANFELPANEGFEPPQELPPGEEDPIKAMDADDVLITIVSDEATGAPGAITLDQLWFLPEATPRVPHGHTLAEGSFCYGARCLRIEVDFGGLPQPALERAVNRVLASLDVERRGELPGQDSTEQRADPGPRGCPRENWPGPWTACAEAEWVRRVVREGGYDVVDETGSALVAEGQGRSFYVWTTPARRKPEAIAGEAGNWRRLAVIDGVPIYGDDELWRFWQAQGFIIWVKEGPRGDSIVPTPAELTRLVEASRVAPPPPE